MVVSVFTTLLLSIACRQLPSVLCLFLIFFAVAVFFVPPRSGGVGFACLLLRCVREPWFPWVSCARRVVCSGAGRAFLLLCLRRYFVRWRSLSLCVGRFCFGSVVPVCPPCALVWCVSRRSSVRFARCLGGLACAGRWRLLSGRFWGAFAVGPCSITAGSSVSARCVPSAGSVLSEVSLPLSSRGVGGRFERLLSRRSWLPVVPGAAVLRWLLCRSRRPALGSHSAFRSVMLAASGVVDGSPSCVTALPFYSRLSDSMRSKFEMPPSAAQSLAIFLTSLPP